MATLLGQWWQWWLITGVSGYPFFKQTHGSCLESFNIHTNPYGTMERWQTHHPEKNRPITQILWRSKKPPLSCSNPMSYVDGWVPNRFGSTQISSKRLFGYTLSDGNIIAVPIMNPSPTLSNLGCINHPKSSKHSRFIIRFTMFTTFYTLHLLCCLPLALQVFKFSRLSHPCLGR